MPTVDQTITYLEMTARDQLVPGQPPPIPFELEELDGNTVGLAHALYVQIGSPHRWVERPEWSLERWREHLARPAIRAWVARAQGRAAGMIELDLQPEGEVEISVFGLVPEFVGRGFGGHLLTLAARLAWEVEVRGRAPTRRVWLHTSTLDHPHALGNYEARGFRAVRRVKRPRPLP